MNWRCATCSRSTDCGDGGETTGEENGVAVVARRSVGDATGRASTTRGPGVGTWFRRRLLATARRIDSASTFEGRRVPSPFEMYGESHERSSMASPSSAHKSDRARERPIWAGAIDDAETESRRPEHLGTSLESLMPVMGVEDPGAREKP